ncbi:MAG TPA: hypothetical protein VNV42_04815 [Solirubrobacteraceae bacterium]|jgi:hypothetical protein|nr:hypothetical protein [Solirubrobacteraceae bacterium]
MHGLVFYIGLGIGLALAAGLRPFLPALLAGALASSGTLGVTFAHGTFHFLQEDWWLLAVCVALALSYAVQILMGLSPIIDPSDRAQRLDPLGAALAGVGIGTGMLLFAGTLAAHHDAAWPGLLGGFFAVGLSQRAFWPLVFRARARLADGGARHALTLYLDAASLVLAALVALLHPLGYVALALCGWMLVLDRRRAGRKYAGLRILGR